MMTLLLRHAAALAALACMTALAAGSAPTIIADLQHNEIVQPEGVKPPAFVVAAGPALRIDARRFDFTKGGYPQLTPNAVHVQIKDSQYFAEWDGASLLELSADTLAPANNAPPFAGFRGGETVVVSLGRKEVDHVKRHISFKVQWSARVRVKS